MSTASVRTDVMPRSTKLGGPLSIRLEPEVRAALEELAKEDDRSLSAYINRALRQHIEDKKQEKKRR
jgi:predicted transcriptional regulator